jgi:hypothetical protein
MNFRSFLLLGALLLLVPFAHGAGERKASPAEIIKPADPNKPLLRVLRFQKYEPGTVTAKGTVDVKPLLVVWAVGDVRLARDQKGVLITLTPQDAKIFAAITQQYNGGLLVLDAGEGHFMEAMHITAPIVDGEIGFKHPAEATAAEYLRRRFRLGEFK